MRKIMLSVNISRYTASSLQGKFSRGLAGIFDSHMQFKYSNSYFFLLLQIIEFISVVPVLK